MNSRDYASLVTGGFLLDPDEEIELMNDYESSSEDRQEAYAVYLESDTWQKLKTETLKRDGYKCVKCSCNKQLQVHHVYYRKWYETKLSDLVTLCNSCHELEHT